MKRMKYVWNLHVLQENVVLRFQLLAVPRIDICKRNVGNDVDIYRFWFRGWMEAFCCLSPLDLISHPASKHLHTHIPRVLRKNEKKREYLKKKKENMRMGTNYRRTFNFRLFISVFCIAKPDKARKWESWKDKTWKKFNNSATVEKLKFSRILKSKIQLQFKI